MGLGGMKVIVHVGFPKTASSSMQFGPLLEKDQAGEINLNTWRKLDPNEPLENRPSSRLFVGNGIPSDYFNYSSHKTNVFSDESFTAPLRLRQCNFGEKIQDPFSFPEIIRKEISERYPEQKLDIVWLGIIRNQKDLITSQYVEEYNWKRFRDIDLLFDCEGEVDLSGYDVYDFYRYINVVKGVAEKFGDDFSFLLYEEMNANPRVFFEKLDDIFGFSSGFFQESFKRNHVNGKSKSRHGTFTKDGCYFVPRLPESVSDSIMDYFEPSNNQLVDFFDRVDLLYYGYIRA
jgi:hypothetical protein